MKKCSSEMHQIESTDPVEHVKLYLAEDLKDLKPIYSSIICTYVTNLNALSNIQ